MLNWANRFSIFCFLDNHHYQIAPNTLDCILAIGASKSISSGETSALKELQSFIDQTDKTLFGHLAYNLKTKAAETVSIHKDHLKFPDYFFFEPEIIIRLNENTIKIESNEDAEKILHEILEADLPLTESDKYNAVQVICKMPE